MPGLDSSGKVVGVLLREDHETGNYYKCYVAISFETHLLGMYPMEAEGKSDLSKFTPFSEIKCQYITKVGIASSRPRILNCFEIVTTGVVHHFCVDSIEERDEWIETIKQSSMRQGSFKNIVSAQKERSKDVGYRTQIVAGVIRRIPIQGEQLDDEDDRSDLTLSGPASIGATPMEQDSNAGIRKTIGFPRIIKAGHATKCGAVMKSWRRRFFVLTETSLGYYKSIEEVDPIRSIPASDLISVGKSKLHSGKDHLVEVGTPQRIFYIQADNDYEMDEWLKAFQTVISSLRISGSVTLPGTSKDLKPRTNSSELLFDSPTDSDNPDIMEYNSSPKIIKSPGDSPIRSRDNGNEQFQSSTEEDCNFTLGTQV